MFVRRRIASLCLALALAACTQPKPGSAGAAAPQAPAATVLAAPLRRQKLPLLREGVGHAAPFFGVTVRPQVDGRLQKVCFSEGDTVQAGQTLGLIDPRPFRIAIDTAQAALTRDLATVKNAQLNLKRYRRLRDDKMVSEQQWTDQEALVSTSEATVLSDRAQLAQAQLQLEYATVKAPITGVTGLRGIDPGNLVRAGDSNGLVTIHQLDPIAVLFSLPQDSLPEVFAAKDANTAVVRVYARDGKTELGEGPLALVDNQVQAQTGTIRLKAVLPNSLHALWPNQFLRVVLELGHLDEAWVVPALSVRTDANEQVVFVVDNDRARRVPVKTLGQADGLVAIEGAFVGGQKVVTDGAARLQDGARLHVQEASSEPTAASP